MDFRTVSVEDLAAQVRAGEVSARELTDGALARIADLNGRYNAFVAVDERAARVEADARDAAVAAGNDPGPLAGVPIGVKDLEDAAGFTTTHGSPAHAGDSPAPADCTLVARLRAAGCVVLGKTNTPEFGWKGETDNPLFGATINPWGEGRSPGGSSGGSAAAIASGMVPLATGSDGGGSIRIPSAVCGLSGFKASLGRVPDGGADAPGWHDLSVKGPMARRIRDVAYALDAVVGPEPRDLRSLPAKSESWRAALDPPTPPLRAAWAPTLGYARVDSEVAEVCSGAVKALEAAGTEVTEIDGPFGEDPVRPWLELSNIFNLRSLERFRDTDVWHRIDPDLVGMLEWAEDHLTPVGLVRALDAGYDLNLALVEVLAGHDVLLAPVCAGQTPVSAGDGTIDGEPDMNWVQLTYPFNLTRSPAGTVCAGFTGDGMPVGLQIVGPQHGDVAVLSAIAVLEDAVALDPMAPVTV